MEGISWEGVCLKPADREPTPAAESLLTAGALTLVRERMVQLRQLKDSFQQWLDDRAAAAERQAAEEQLAMEHLRQEGECRAEEHEAKQRRISRPLRMQVYCRSWTDRPLQQLGQPPHQPPPLQRRPRKGSKRRKGKRGNTRRMLCYGRDCAAPAEIHCLVQLRSRAECATAAKAQGAMLDQRCAQ